MPDSRKLIVLAVFWTVVTAIWFIILLSFWWVYDHLMPVVCSHPDLVHPTLGYFLISFGGWWLVMFALRAALARIRLWYANRRAFK